MRIPEDPQFPQPADLTKASLSPPRVERGIILFTFLQRMWQERVVLNLALENKLGSVTIYDFPQNTALSKSKFKRRIKCEKAPLPLLVSSLHCSPSYFILPHFQSLANSSLAALIKAIIIFTKVFAGFFFFFILELNILCNVILSVPNFAGCIAPPAPAFLPRALPWHFWGCSRSFSLLLEKMLNPTQPRDAFD